MPVHPLSWSVHPSAHPSSVLSAPLFLPVLSLLVFPASHPVAGRAFSCAALFPEVASLRCDSGDPLPPPEPCSRSCWKLGAGAQECWVSWHVTPGPRCRIPEPWSGQAMPREGRSWTLMSPVVGRPGPNSIPCLRLPFQSLDIASLHPSSLCRGSDSAS